MRKAKWIAKRAMLVFMTCMFILSFNFFEGIGPKGLAEFLMFMVSGGYVVLSVYANWTNENRRGSCGGDTGGVRGF